MVHYPAHMQITAWSYEFGYEISLANVSVCLTAQVSYHIGLYNIINPDRSDDKTTKMTQVVIRWRLYMNSFLKRKKHLSLLDVQ